MRLRTVRIAFAGVALAVAGLARADTASRGPGGLLAARAAVRLEEIPGRLVQMEASATGERDVADLDRRLAAMWRRLTARAADVGRADLEEAAELQIAQRDVEHARRQLGEWSAMLAGRIPVVERNVAEVRAMRDELFRTLHRLKHGPAPRAAVRRSAEILRQVRAMRAELEAHLGELLELQRRVASQRATADELHERFDVAERRVLGMLYRRDSVPLWSAWSEVPSIRQMLATAGATFASDWATTGGYLNDERTFLPATIGVLLLAWAAALGLRRLAVRPDGPDASLVEATRVLDRPATIALLAVPVVLFLPQYDNAPILLRALLGAVAIVPLVRIVARLVPATEAGAAHVLAVLLLMDLLAIACRDMPVTGRLLSLGSYGLALGLLFAARGHERPAPLRLVRNVASALLVVAVVANLAGFVHLSQYLGRGVVLSLLIGVLWLAFLAVIDASVAIAVQTGVSAAVRTHAGGIRRAAHNVARLVVLVVWLWAVLDVFAVRDPVTHALDVVFGTKLNVGAMALSLGDVLAFGVTVWLSFQLSRAVGAVLEGDVLPRMALERGIPYAVTTLSSYAVMIVGFFFALAAAGATLDRVAVLVGALGVGVGFGLQTIVNNFVSGLVLLFERPIQIGDMVQLGDVVGVVRRIGFRSSVLRTSEGAEVIVPNSQLIGGQVTNWTLSDPRRRVSVRVAVPSGTDPELVQSILVGVARGHPGVLPEPAPEALFVGFGDKLDFELRTWVGRPDVVSSFRSALGIGIGRALREAGITQSDAAVHRDEPDVVPASATPAAVARQRG